MTQAVDWRAMETAPRDGSRFLAVVHRSEQWPAEVELVRWGTPRHEAEACWHTADSGPSSTVVFSEGELACWMPLPRPPAGV